jgi:Cu-Zn family superoxide dismutase
VDHFDFSHEGVAMKIRILTKLLATTFLFGAAVQVTAATVVPMTKVDANGIGPSVGQITITETPYGMVFTPSLSGLTPGLHGFHLHEKPSCAAQEKDGKPVAALAAGGHFDPQGAKQHGAPWGDGHLGDLPPLYVDADGNATQPVLAPRLKLGDLPGHALMLHGGGDNHADHPQPLGGGGARVACGVIE